RRPGRETLPAVRTSRSRPGRAGPACARRAPRAGSPASAAPCPGRAHRRGAPASSDPLLLRLRDVHPLEVEREAGRRQLAPEAPDQLVVPTPTAEHVTHRGVVDL